MTNGRANTVIPYEILRNHKGNFKGLVKELKENCKGCCSGSGGDQTQSTEDEVENGFSHDFTKTIIVESDLLNQSGSSNTKIDQFTIVPKGNGVTYTRGGATAKVEQARALTIGTQSKGAVSSGWTINNPNGIEINITWDEIL